MRKLSSIGAIRAIEDLCLLNPSLRTASALTHSDRLMELVREAFDIGPEVHVFQHPLTERYCYNEYVDDDDEDADQDAEPLSAEEQGYADAYVDYLRRLDRIEEVLDPLRRTWNEVAFFHQLGWDVTNEHGLPLYCLPFVGDYLLFAIRDEFGAKLPEEGPSEAEQAKRLAAEAARWKASKVNATVPQLFPGKGRNFRERNKKS